MNAGVPGRVVRCGRIDVGQQRALSLLPAGPVYRFGKKPGHTRKWMHAAGQKHRALARSDRLYSIKQQKRRVQAVAADGTAGAIQSFTARSASSLARASITGSVQ